MNLLAIVRAVLLRLLLLLAIRRDPTNNGKASATGAASQLSTCVGNLEAHSADQDLYICAGTTLLNASFLDGPFSLSIVVGTLIVVVSVVSYSDNGS